MKIPQALAVLPVVLITVLDPSAADAQQGGAPTAAAALQRLAAARADLSQAVARIEKDPPSTADLDAAHAAIEALKEVIDTGAEHEGKDLEYAKAALAARKELRTQREYVEQRRASIHLHDLREQIDRALTTLSDRAQRVESKEANAKDFDEARTAAAAVRKAMDEARPFAKQDQKFASYLGEVDATLARQEKGIDQRWILLSVEKQRSLVEEGRQALSASMGALGKGGSDAQQFDSADRAATLLAKRLDEGKSLEAMDKTYRSDADRARTELAQARKRIDEVLRETGLARLKAEIEPAYKDLTATAQGLRTRKPTADQLAEARTAAIVVRKLLEKFQPQASRIPAFGQYVSEVKKTLVEVELEVERRGVDSARADLAQALKNIERRAPTDEHFEEANTALLILEKTVQSVHTKDEAMLKSLADARELLRTARTTMAKRRLEVDVQRQRAKVEEARKSAVALVGQAHKSNAGQDALDAAEKAIEQLRAELEKGAALSKKDREYAQYSREAGKRTDELNERIAQRKVALAASDARGQLNELIAGTRAKLEAAKQPTATDPDIEAASQSVEQVNRAIEAKVVLEKQDKGYAAQADRARNELQRLREALEFAKQARTLRRLTVEALAAGASAADSAAAAPDLRTQKEQCEKAIDEFKSCESAGTAMIGENRALAKVAMLVDGQPSTAKEVIAQCVQRAQATEQSLKQVLPLLAFEEGPKRSFETAKVLLAQAKKNEALNQFDECISTGLILQHRNPELKDRKFEVAGASMTLTDLVQQCVKDRKPLKAK